jgi:hypothetical protein
MLSENGRREPDAGDLHARFDERDVEMVETLRHRQTKEAACGRSTKHGR